MTVSKLRFSHPFLSHRPKNKCNWSPTPEKILTQTPTGICKHLTIFLLKINPWNATCLLPFWSPEPGGIFYYRSLKKGSAVTLHTIGPLSAWKGKGKKKKGIKGFSRGGIWQLCTVNISWNSSFPNLHLNTWYRFPILSWKSSALEGGPGSIIRFQSNIRRHSQVAHFPSFFRTDISLLIFSQTSVLSLSPS